MLQRHLLAQKRHLESIFSICSYPTFSPIFNVTTPSLHLQLPQRAKLFTSIARATEFNHFAEDTTHVFLYDVQAFAPPEFSRVMDAVTNHSTLGKIVMLVKDTPTLLSFFSKQKLVREVVKGLARSPTPHHTLQILDLAHQLGHTLNASAYESVSFHLAHAKKWHLLLNVISASQEHGHSTLRLLNWRSLALLKLKQYSSLQGMVEEFNNAGITPDRRTYHTILSGCLRNSDLEGAKRCLRMMNEAGLPLDAMSHTIIGCLYRKFNADPQVSSNAIQSLPSLAPAARTKLLNHLLQSYLDIDDLSTARILLSLYETLDDQNTLLSAIHALVVDRSAPQFDSLPQNLQISPNSDTFAILMNYHIRKSDYNSAVQLAQTTVSLNLPPTQTLIASLIHAYFLGGYSYNALFLVSRICKKGSFGNLGRFVKESKRDQIIPLDLDQVKLSARLCNALMRGLLDTRGLAIVPALFSAMRANNIEPNSRTLELLLSYMNRINVPHARTLFQVLRAFMSPTFGPSIQYMHHIVTRVFREEKQKFIRSSWGKYPRFLASTKGSIFRLLSPRRRFRLLGTTDEFDPLAGIQLVNPRSYSRAAYRIVTALQATGVKSDSVMAFLRMRKHAVLHSDLETAERIFRTLMARGLRPNEYHFGALVEGYALAGNFKAAMETMKTASRAGVKLNVVIWTNLIAGYVRHGEAKSALQVFKQMIAAGIDPDPPSIDAVVNAFHKSGDPQEARDLLIKLWTYIEPFPETLRNADMSTLLAALRALRIPLSKRQKYSRAERHCIYHCIRKIIRAYRRHFMPRTQ